MAGMGGMGGMPGGGGGSFRRRQPVEPQKVEVRPCWSYCLLHLLELPLLRCCLAVAEPVGCRMVVGLSTLHHPPSHSPPSQVPLSLTLEELYSGCTKRRKVTRNIVDGASGKTLAVEETLEIPVKAGWKDGTRVTFTGGCWVGGALGGWGLNGVLAAMPCCCA